MKKYSLLIVLTIILNVFNILNVSYAATVSYRPTLDTPGKMAWSTETMVYQDQPWTIYLARHDTGTRSGIIFDNVYVPQGALINSANLTLYYPTGVDFNTNSITCTIYGYNGDNIATLTLDLLVNGPYTAALNVFNCSTLDSKGYYTIDVSNIVQEIVNRYSWFSGNNLALVIIAARQTEDSIQFYYEAAANYGAYSAYRPTLSIRYNEAPDAPPTQEYVEQYKNFTIWKTRGGWYLMSMGTGVNSRIMTWEALEYGGLITNRTMTNNGVISEMLNNMAAVNNTVYRMEYVQADEDLELWKSIDVGLTWSLVQELDTAGAKNYASMWYDNYTNTIWFTWGESFIWRTGMYNLTSGVWNNYGIVYSGATAEGGADIITDDQGNAYWVRQGGDSLGSTHKTRIAIKPAGGSWGASVQIFDDTYTYLRPQLIYSPDYEALILTFKRSGSGHWVTYHNMTDPITTWSTPVRVTDTSSTTLYSPCFRRPYDTNPGRIYIGTEDPDLGTDDLPLFSYMDWPFTGSRTEYNEANFTGQDFSGSTPILFYNGSIGFATMRYTSGAAVYFTRDMSFFQYPKIVADWAFITVAEDWETPNSYSNAKGQRQSFTEGINWIVKYPNGTVVPPGKYPCLALARTLEEIKACLDKIAPEEYPDDPAGGGFTGDEDPYMGRIAFKRYFTLAGLFMICAPWVLLVVKKDPAFIPILIILNALGIGLLLGVIEF